MGQAIGIDLGGTKVEAQVFDRDWSLIERRRIDTPKVYERLVDAMVEQITWAIGIAGNTAPIGIGAAGLISPITGEALTSNLVATGHPFPADIEAKAGRKITYINDCRALALSEAVFGAAKGLSPVVGLIIGTGVGGGVVVNDTLVDGPGNFGGEFGHLPSPADLVAKYDLPIVTCGCKRQGCIETYISGPGLERLAKHFTGRDMWSPDIAKNRHDDRELTRAWSVWRELVVDLLRTIALVVDPEAVVLGGGLSNIEGLAPELTNALAENMWPGYPAPKIIIAEGGDVSGARGAAYAAWRETQ